MSSKTPKKYKTRNWADYNLSLKNRGSLSIWFDAEMTWETVPSGRRGRQHAYRDPRLNPSGVSGSSASNRLVQQSRQSIYSDLAIAACLTLGMV
jgi:hypothetical protein